MHSRGTGTRRRAALERLEPRQLLSIDVISKANQLRIVGTDLADDVSVTPHAALMNVLRVVVKNAKGREERLFSVGRFTSIGIWGEGGNDTIKIDDALLPLAEHVSVSLSGGTGNDVITACPLGGSISLGDGDDCVSVKARSRLTIAGGDGEDHIEVGVGDHVINGDGGNDTILGNDGGKIDGGAGNDRITMTGHRHTYPHAYTYPSIDRDPAIVHGGDGDDTLTGTDCPENLYGDAGSDQLIAHSSSEQDQFYGGDGDDVLDASGAYKVTLHGGAGNDDLYSGYQTTGYGEAGRDWFEDDDGWLTTDHNGGDIRKGGKPNVPTYPGYGSSSSADFVLAGSLIPWYTINAIGDVGFVVARSRLTQSPGRSVSGWGYTPPGPASLTLGERKSLHNGIMRLEPSWRLTNVRRANGGTIVWYDVEYNSKHDRPSTSDYLGISQIGVKAGTVLVTSGGKAKETGTLAYVRADTTAMWLGAGSTARIAGSDSSTYTIAGDVPGDAITAPKGRRGILVKGGVLWMSVDGATTFQKIG